MRKSLLLLFLILCTNGMIVSPSYANPDIAELHEELTDEGPELDLDDDGVVSDDDDLLEILDESIEKPSLLWTWFQTVGSSFIAHCIHAQQYMSRLFNRMRLWFRIGAKQRQNKMPGGTPSARSDF